MINQEFCSKLEYEICRILSASTNQNLAGFWCDGVILHDDCNIKNNTIIGKAYIGKTGQDEYELLLSFSNESIKSGLENFDFNATLTEFKIDIQKRIFKLYL